MNAAALRHAADIRTSILIQDKWSNKMNPQNLEPQPEEYTGGSVSYYRVGITSPTSADVSPYVAECNDIIEALGMSFAEGNAFKALWRMCAARQLQLKKKGYTDGLYDAEKVVFFGQRLVAQLSSTDQTSSFSNL